MHSTKPNATGEIVWYGIQIASMKLSEDDCSMQEKFAGNLYIFIPACRTATPAMSTRFDVQIFDSVNCEVVDEISLRAQTELFNSVTDSIRRFKICEIDLLCTDRNEVDHMADYEYHTASIIGAYDEKSSLLVLTLVLSEFTQPVSGILDQMSGEALTVRTDGILVKLDDYMRKNFDVIITGSSRACISFCSKADVSLELVTAFLACETYNSRNMDAAIISPELAGFASENIAQYTSSDLFVGPKAVVRIDRRSEVVSGFPTIQSDSVLLFILEVLVFKEAAIARTNTNTISCIESSQTQSLSSIESLILEFGTTIRFWSTRVFRYTTAAILANHIEQAFGIPEKLNDLKRNQKHLEQLVNIKTALISESEGKLLDNIAIVLFFFSIIPATYSLVFNFMSGSLFGSQDSNIALSVSASFAAIFFIIIVFSRRKKNERA